MKTLNKEEKEIIKLIQEKKLQTSILMLNTTIWERKFNILRRYPKSL